MDREEIKKNVIQLRTDFNPHLFLAKRCFDIVFSCFALIILTPLMLGIAIVILIDDPRGGIIFVQRRRGKNNKEFDFYKFRSMYKNAKDDLDKLLEQNEMDGPVFKIKDDPRITRVGRFIRKTSLDELPQFWNVLKGDMSIVGPRPPIPREVDQYTSYQMKRLSIKPGLTCYWQIQPRRNDLKFDEWVELDLKYINDMSFSVDMKILIKTIGVMLRMQGV